MIGENRDTKNLKPGEEQYKHYRDRLFQKNLVKYAYRHTNGQLFSTTAMSLEYARGKRDSWIRIMKMVEVMEKLE